MPNNPELRKLMNDQINDGKTHWEGCWQDHHACALHELNEAQHAIAARDQRLEAAEALLRYYDIDKVIAYFNGDVGKEPWRDELNKREKRIADLEKQPTAWGEDVPLHGPDAPKWNGKIEHLIRYLLTVYKRFGNTAVTANLQWGASALYKRDEQNERIAALERDLNNQIEARNLLGIRAEKAEAALAKAQEAADAYSKGVYSKTMLEAAKAIAEASSLKFELAKAREDARDLREDHARMREALISIKQHVCGDAMPRWENTPNTTWSRGHIADWADNALASLKVKVEPEQDTDPDIEPPAKPELHWPLNIATKPVEGEG